ncbi:hypothetical protein GCM10007937_41650 [Mesorhizobium albiziae]|nr:hypothetical protein GCM10007937_41650 [Mesorhizobium albiziae]
MGSVDRLWPELAYEMADAFFAMLTSQRDGGPPAAKSRRRIAHYRKIQQDRPSGNREKADDAGNQPLADDRHH